MTKKIAVYGSLRKDLGNNPILFGSNFLGEFQTEPIFSLYDLGWYPGLKPNGNTSIKMEVYEVSEIISKRVDQLE